MIKDLHRSLRKIRDSQYLSYSSSWRLWEISFWVCLTVSIRIFPKSHGTKSWFLVNKIIWAMKGNTGCWWFIWGLYYPVIWGIIVNHYKDLYYFVAHLILSHPLRHEHGPYRPRDGAPSEVSVLTRLRLEEAEEAQQKAEAISDGDRCFSETILQIEPTIHVLLKILWDFS